MAIVRNAANTLKKGRVGETTYYISKGQQVARQSRNDSNYGESARRTILQQNRRVLWANLVQFYKISASWMPKAFESKKSGQTDYNKFMAVNVPSSRIALTRSQAEAGACVVDGYLVSQGSLPSIDVIEMVGQWKTNLLIGSLTIGDSTTVADLTEALLANNANCRAGMQLSFASYQQSVDPLGTPRVNCRLYELTLSTTDTSTVFEHIPAMGCTSVDGAIGTSTDVPTGGFAWIMSELQNGVLRVSTQLLTTKNSAVIIQMSSAQQVDLAVKSYGVDSEVILNPATTVQQGAEPSVLYIEYIEAGGSRYYPGQNFGFASKIAGQTITVVFNQDITGKLYSCSTGIGEKTLQINSAEIDSQTGTEAVIDPGFTQETGYTLMNISFTLTGGGFVKIDFAPTSGGGDMG